MAPSVRTNISRTALSNETGNYSFTNLASGVYRVEGELVGFRKFARDNRAGQGRASTEQISVDAGKGHPGWNEACGDPADFFNATNTPHYDKPGGTFGNASFGRVTSIIAQTERMIRFGGRFLF